MIALAQGVLGQRIAKKIVGVEVEVAVQYLMRPEIIID
jgi:hypothetical protein